MNRFRKQNWGRPAVHRFLGAGVLIHGGLGDQLKRRSEILLSLRLISKQIQNFLKKEKPTAVELVLKAVELLEADPTFNSGYGARLQKDGVARLSASLMDGSRQKLSAVANIMAMKHPSKLLPKLLERKDRSLASMEANQFAFRHGFRPENVETPKRIEEWKKFKEGKSGTVGAVAVDSSGKAAACTSTGGRGFETPGRVSDSFTPAGNFANPFGAVSCTGTGEEILEVAAASSILTRVEDSQSLAESISRTFERHMEKDFGVISITPRGEACVYATRGAMSYAFIQESKIFYALLPEEWQSFTKNDAQWEFAGRSRKLSKKL